MLLSSYKEDDNPNLMSICKEHNDILALIIEYLDLKEIGEEEKFSKKHLEQLKMFTSSYIGDYENYREFAELGSSDSLVTMEADRYDKIMGILQENDEIMEETTMEALIQISSFDGALQVIDKCKSREDFQQIIEELMLNKDHDRTTLLYEKGIDSYGFKRLRKELNKYVAK